jgi:hypothetical protein
MAPGPEQALLLPPPGAWQSADVDSIAPVQLSPAPHAVPHWPHAEVSLSRSTHAPPQQAPMTPLDSGQAWLSAAVAQFTEGWQVPLTH